MWPLLTCYLKRYESDVSLISDCLSVLKIIVIWFSHMQRKPRSVVYPGCVILLLLSLKVCACIERAKCNWRCTVKQWHSQGSGMEGGAHRHFLVRKSPTSKTALSLSSWHSRVYSLLKSYHIPPNISTVFWKSHGRSQPEHGIAPMAVRMLWWIVLYKPGRLFYTVFVFSLVVSDVGVSNDLSSGVSFSQSWALRYCVLSTMGHTFSYFSHEQVWFLILVFSVLH